MAGSNDYEKPTNYRDGTRVPLALFVCTANRCRSPIAAALFVRDLEQFGLDFEVRSAGLLEGGAPAPKGVIRAMAEQGIDLSTHRSHRLEARDVIQADLIIGLERHHVREVVVASPDETTWGRTFTLRELVRRASTVGPRASDQSLESWVESIHRGRRREEMFGASSLDDIVDPFGKRLSAYRIAAAEIAELIRALVAFARPTLASFDKADSTPSDPFTPSTPRPCGPPSVT